LCKGLNINKFVNWERFSCANRS